MGDSLIRVKAEHNHPPPDANEIKQEQMNARIIVDPQPVPIAMSRQIPIPANRFGEIVLND